jgi:PEP-CTERM motif
MTRKIGAFGTRSNERQLALCGLAVAAALAAASPASAVVVYDESVSGDLSNSGLTPTPLAFGVGDNIVQGTIGHDQAGAIDRDYFTFTIGANQVLTAIDILQGTQTLGLSFIGIESGPQVTLATNSATAAGLLGWTHYGAADIGTDVLDNMSVAANGSTGFSRPLGAGTYSIWLQEISPGGAVPFGLDFVVAQVPEPSAWAMMLAGFGMLGLAFRRRRAVSVKARAALA